MNEKELQEFVTVLLLKNEIEFFDFSTKKQIEIFEEFFTYFGKTIEQKERDEKTLFRFLNIIKELGPRNGSNTIYAEIKNDNYWNKMFDYFLGTGMLNLGIIKTFISLNKQMREKDVLVLNEINRILNNLKMLEQKENN